MDLYKRDAWAMARLQQRMGDSCPGVTWNGQPVPIIPGSADLKLALGEGGFSKNGYLWFEVLVSSWPGAYPDVNTLKDAIHRTDVTYLGFDYQITDVNVRGGGQKLMIECVSATEQA